MGPRVKSGVSVTPKSTLPSLTAFCSPGSALANLASWLVVVQ